MMKRLLEQSDDDSQLTQLLQRRKQAVLQAEQYAQGLGGTQIQMLRGRPSCQ